MWLTPLALFRVTVAAGDDYFDRAAFASSRPPVAVLPARDDVGTALLRIALLICAAVAPLCVEAYSATAPVTCGVAIEVPL